MKNTFVPAQVTTVEDRITGSLSVTQLFLLTAPIFVGCIVYLLLPPFFTYAMYKVVLVAAIAALSGSLAVRFKGKILLFWALIYFGYKLRPRFYVLNKNDGHMRTFKPHQKAETHEAEIRADTLPSKQLSSLKTSEIAKIESILANPAAGVHFDFNKKGELRVRFTETQE
jgi:hypothetical protein